MRIFIVFTSLVLFVSCSTKIANRSYPEREIKRSKYLFQDIDLIVLEVDRDEDNGKLVLMKNERYARMVSDYLHNKKIVQQRHLIEPFYKSVEFYLSDDQKIEKFYAELYKKRKHKNLLVFKFIKSDGYNFVENFGRLWSFLASISSVGMIPAWSPERIGLAVEHHTDEKLFSDENFVRGDRLSSTLLSFSSEYPWMFSRKWREDFILGLLENQVFLLLETQK